MRAHALLALALLPAVAHGPEIYLKVTSPGLQRVTMGLPRPEAPAATLPGVAEFDATLRADLERTAVIAVLSEERARLVERDPGDPRLTRQRWRAVGAQFFLELSPAVVGERFTVEARLWDLATGEITFSRRLAGTSALAGTVAHTLANELVRTFTGRPGPFLSRIAFASDRSGARELWLMRWDGSEAQQLTNHRSIALGPAFSPDGQWLAFTSYLRGKPQLFALRPTQGYIKPVSTLPGVNSSPSFSPDGRRIAFAAGDDGNTDIYVTDINGATPERLTVTRAIETQPAWSPNGRQIAFTSTLSGSPQIYVMDAEGTNVRRVTTTDAFADEAAWAPDGVRIAYTTLVDRVFQVAILDLRDGSRTVVAGPGSNESPAFSPDGTSLAFVSTRTGSKQIFVTGPDGVPVQITRAGNNTGPSWVAQVQ